MVVHPLVAAGMSVLQVGSTGAITMWVRSQIRRDWRALTLIALSVAIAGGFAMTAGIGARRAASTWDQFLTRTNMPDVAKEVLSSESGAALAELRSREGVTSAVRMSYMSVGLEGAEPTGAFVGRDPGFGTEIYRPVVVSGRAADPTRADEFTINPVMAESTGLRPGERVIIVSPDDVVHQPATMVGITVGAFDTGVNGGTQGMLLTPAFGAKWFAAYFAALPATTQAAYRDALLAQVAAPHTTAQLLGEQYVGGTDLAGDDVTAALGAEGTAYTVLAVVAALGTLIAIGQVVSRRVRRRAVQAPTLAAMGLAPGGRRAALAGSHACAVAVGALLVPVVAYLASPVTGRGLVAQVDPNRAHVTDTLVMAGGTVAGFIVLVGVAVTAAWRADARPGHESARTRANLMLPGPAGMFGGRVAAGWVGRSDRAAARAHVALSTLAVASVTATLVWSGAAGHAVATPARYGATWDAAVIPAADGPDDLDSVKIIDDAQARLTAHPGIGSVLGRGVAGMVETDSERIEVLQIDRAAGSWWPPLLAGRVPENPYEITVGSRVLDTGVRLGDQVVIGGGSFTVVGEHVASTWSNGDFGETVATTGNAVAQSDLDVPTAVMWVGLGHDASLEQLATIVGDAVEVRGATEVQPSQVTNLAGIGRLDELLLLVCVLLAFATLANGIVIATKPRQRDHATMRALGAAPSAVAGSVLWHTTIVTAIGGVVGVSLGVIAGAMAWRHTAHTALIGGALHRPGVVVFVVLTMLFAMGLLVAGAAGAGAVRRSRARLSIE